MRVLIAAGGSGGHIFPAIALAKALSDKDDVKFVGSDSALDRRIFEKENFAFSLLSTNKLPSRPSFGMIPFIVKLKIDFWKALFIIRSYKPDVVVGFGGYVSFPVLLAASFFGIPRIVHEQNVRPGRANRALFRFADRIAVSFEETRAPRFTERSDSKSVLTGNPIRSEVLRDDRASGIRKFGLDASRFTILVIGGSQGAHFLNETFIAAMAGVDAPTRRLIQVIHLTGVKDYEKAVSAYAGITGLESRVFSFIDRIEEAYSASDLIVTRAGSSAIFEAAAFGRPMILVPYPFAMSHQLENAASFAKRGAAVVLEEKELSAETFRDGVLKLFRDEAARRRLGESARLLSAPDAAERLAGEVMRLHERRIDIKK